MVDKSKQIYGWWTFVDYEVYCSCGNHIQNCEDGESTRIWNMSKRYIKNNPFYKLESD